MIREMFPLTPHADVHQRNMMAMMVSLQRRLETGSDADRERQFFKHALRYLTTSSGRQIEMEDWMITSYDVEFGHEIGSGGLYVPTFLTRTHGIFAQNIFLAVGRCSKGVGTKRVWHSKCLCWKMVSCLHLRFVNNGLY
jgi:hypothetical protein